MLEPYVDIVKQKLCRTFMQLVEWREDSLTERQMSMHNLGTKELSTAWNYEQLSQEVANYYNQSFGSNLRGDQIKFFDNSEMKLISYQSLIND
jgi:hypothetical protein